MSTLITAANSAQAQQLKNILDVGDVILGDYLEIPALLIEKGKMIKTPNPASSSFVHQMLSLCLDKGIDKLYPLRRQELLPLAEARQLFTEFNITLYVPSVTIINNYIPYNIIDGEIIIVENAKGINTDTLKFAARPFPSGENGDGMGFGVFKVNSEGYNIFTAD